MYLGRQTYAAVCRDFPLDVIAEILSRPPIVNIIQCKTVCKSWYKLTTEHHFIDMQKNRALCQPGRIILVSQDPQTSFFLLDKRRENKWKCRKIFAAESINVGKRYTYNYIADSCNGLLLLASSSTDEPLLISNPITRECVGLPKLDHGGENKFKKGSRYGIGFDSISKKYKVVCVYGIFGYNSKNSSSYYEGRTTRCQIMTLGEGSWRPLEVPCYVPLQEFDRSETVFLNEAFHWLIDTNDVRSSKSELFILALDITSEQFHITNFFPSMKITESLRLINLAESLALVGSAYLNKNVLFHIWDIVNCKSVGSLVKQYTRYTNESLEAMDGKLCFRLARMLGMLNNESFVYQERQYGVTHVGFELLSDRLALYSPQKEESIILEIADIPELFYAELFVPTLISPTAIL